MNTNLILDLDDPFVSHSFAPIRAHSCSFVAEIPFLDYYNSASGDLETGQEFAVTVRSEDRRFNDADRTHSQIGGEGGDLFDDAPLRRLVAHDAAFPDLFAPDFELRFDERDHEGGFPNQGRNYGKDFGQGNE